MWDVIKWVLIAMVTASIVVTVACLLRYRGMLRDEYRFYKNAAEWLENEKTGKDKRIE